MNVLLSKALRTDCGQQSALMLLEPFEDLVVMQRHPIDVGPGSFDGLSHGSHRRPQLVAVIGLQLHQLADRKRNY